MYGLDLRELVRRAQLRSTRPASAPDLEPVRAAIPPMRVPSFTGYDLERRRDHLRGSGDPAHDSRWDGAEDDDEPEDDDDPPLFVRPLICGDCHEVLGRCLCEVPS